MIRLAAAISLLALLSGALPAGAQSITCPPGTKLDGTESDAGKFQWCEQATPGGPIRQGPMVGFHRNGRRSFELTFVEGTPRGTIRAWYEGGQPSMTGETRPDNGTLILWDERGRRRAQIDVRDRQVVTQAWDEQGKEERYDEKKLVKVFPANRNLSFIMNLFAVGIGIQ
ncbi:MAG TPA: hypothetical protein VL086_14960 [Candidatus Nitrosotalea sp.]|jgi:hypothetical protein|nr:hypothetical protein [Candidatus Nitrosotalea sp.]